MSSEHLRDETLRMAVIGQVFCVICIPIYVYGIFKWMQFKYHIMIQKRFPALSMAMIVMSFSSGVIVTIGRWIQHNELHNNRALTIAASIAYFIYNLIILRLFLIYLRYKQNQQKHIQTNTEELSVISISSSVETEASPSATNIITEEHDTSKPLKSVYRHWFIITLLIFTFPVCIYIAFGDTSSNQWVMILAAAWFINFILTISVIIIIVCYKAKDGLGCMNETIIMLFWAFLIFIFGGLMQQFPALVVPVTYTQNVSSYLFGMIPLYGALYYIYHFEGTLNNKVWINKQKESDFEEKHNDDIDDVHNDDILSKTKLSMFVFLDSEYKNYNAFREYLSYCWSLENLLFVERISIIYQIILQYKSLCNDDMNEEQKQDDNDQNDNVSVQNQLYRMQFKYHKSIYAQYEKIINSNDGENNNKEYKLENVRISLNKIYRKIFKEFIQNGAMNEVNISYKVRQILSFILNGSDNMEKLQTFDDYLNLFDDALKEIYQLLLSMYSFQFKDYLRSHNV